MDQYNFIPLAIGWTALYAASWLAARKGILGQTLHKQIWNAALLFSFLSLMVLSMILVAIWSFRIMNPLPIDVTFWHVEAGISVVFLSVFHILRQLNYFKAYIIKPKPPPQEKKA
jgi:hypothetical protein